MAPDDAHAHADAPEPPGAASSEAITDHLICMECGYDLHGLRDDGHCPECGGSIARTLRTRRHSRGWLIALSSGAQAMLVAHYVILVSMVLFPLLPLGVCFYLLLMLGGAIELGSPGPGGLSPDPRARIPGRRIGAGMIAAVVALMLIGVPLLAVGIMALALLAMVSGIVYLWLVYAHILRRGLSLQAATLSSMLAWMYGSATALSLLDLMLLLLADNASSVAGLAALIGVLTIMTWVATIIIALVALHIGQAAVDRALKASENLSTPNRRAELETRPVTIR